MPKIKIDETEYEIDNLSDDAKAQLISIQFVDNEISRLQSKLAAYQTARVGYARALAKVLEDSGDSTKTEVEIEGLGDTITFD